MELKEIINNGLKREYELILSAKDIQLKYNSELNNIAVNTKMPGFRPGKVPMSLIKQKHSAEIFKNTTEKMLDEGRKQILEKYQIRPAMEPRLEFLSKPEEGKDIKVKVVMEIIPNIKIIDFSEQSFIKYNSKITDKDIDIILNRLAETQKDYKSITEDRGAKKGDGVVIDYKGLINSEAFEGNEGKDFKIDLGVKSSLPGFEDNIIGAKKGDKIKIETKFPEDYPNKKTKGKDVVFDVEIKDILQANKLEIGPELAKKNGMPDLNTLKKNIGIQLNKNTEDMSFAIIKKDILDFLDNNHTFDLPKTMVDYELQSIIAQIEKDKEGNSEVKNKNEDKSSLEREHNTLAKRRVKLGLIISELGMKYGVKVETKEIENAVLLHARQFPGQEKEIFEYYKNNPQAVNSIRGPIFEDKVIKLVIDKSKIDEKIIDQDALNKKLNLIQNPENNSKKSTKKKTVKNK